MQAGEEDRHRAYESSGFQDGPCRSRQIRLSS